MTKTERHAPLAAGIALALPTLLARYLPMSDLPLHESVVGVLRHFSDPSYFTEGLYQLNLGHPNQLFHLTAWLLSLVVSTSMACKLVVAASQIAMLVGAARFADHVGRTRWSALLVSPLALGFTYYWGLVANLAGFAALLLALPIIDRAVLRPSVRGALQTFGCFVLLYFAHESVLVSAVGIVALFALLRPLSPRETALRLAPVFVAAGAIYGQKVWQAHLFPSAIARPAPIFWSLGERFKYLPNGIYGSYAPIEQLMLLGVSLVIVALLLLGRVAERRTKTDTARDPATDVAPPEAAPAGYIRRTKLWELRFELVGLLHFAAFLTAPFAWNGATMVHERFLGPAWAILVVVAGPRKTASASRILGLLAPMLPLGILLLSWPQFVDASGVYTRLDRIIERIPKNRSVAQAVVDRSTVHNRVFSANTSPARVVADRGGRSGLWLASPIAPALIRPEWQWNDYDRRVTFRRSMEFMLPHDFERWEYLIVVSRDPDTRRRARIATISDAELVAEEGEFLLFHSRFPPPSLASHETKAPVGQQTTLVDRLFAIEAEERRIGGPLPEPAAPAPVGSAPTGVTP